jgi:hypothetical protein
VLVSIIACIDAAVVLYCSDGRTALTALGPSAGLQVTTKWMNLPAVREALHCSQARTQVEIWTPGADLDYDCSNDDSTVR